MKLKNFVLFSLFFCLSLNASPPHEIPTNLLNEFTNGGQIPVVHYYIDETSQSHMPFYSKDLINRLIIQAKLKQPQYYRNTDIWLFEMLDEHPNLFKEKTVAVLGSGYPWYEAVVLAYGGQPVSIDYRKIETNDSRLNVMTVEAYKNKPRKFDVLLSISSFEHDGLGRYGNPLDPNGDLRAMRDCFDMIYSTGKLILAVPVGQDCLVWNAHRIYGPKRLSKLLQGWEVLDYKGDYPSMFQLPSGNYYEQPVFLLQPGA
ncbi:DUF268 domain-containing protein [Simkania sp.]|uniref:DUF268 domain-containing protein n=1 Tax=Simkania sp. TaxID=34094 RepID=UPI003B51B329